jgi:acetyl esterase/lipase
LAARRAGLERPRLEEELGLSWLRKALIHLALSRSDAALIKASGGEPRTVRGFTLEPRIQYIEAETRRRAVPPEELTLERRRAQTETLAELFGGAKVSGVQTQRISVSGRSHSVPCRLYLPRVRDNDAAMLVYFHFGGGVVGSLESCHRLCALISKYSGAPVLSVDYRLAPEHRFPAGLDDAVAAYAWAVENSARFGGAVRKAAVGGDSIGATFAAVVAQEARGGRRPAPVLQLLIYPVTDLVSDTASTNEFADAFPLTAEKYNYLIERYVPDGVDPSDPRLSPGRVSDLRGVAPALVYTAGFDILLDQGEAYADHLAEAGVRVKRARFDSLPHGFIAFPSAAPAAEAALKKIALETAEALKGSF